MLSATVLLACCGIGYPRCALPCLFKSLTGFDCPACGAQRALHALSCGAWREAFWQNPYLAIVGAGSLTIVLFRAFAPRKKAVVERWLRHPLSIALFACCMVGWWIFRNTDCWLSIYS